MSGLGGMTALPFSGWPTSRKLAAGLFAIMGYVALACAAVYLAGVLFLVLNKANPRQAGWTSIAHYWQLYADDAALRKKLVASMAVSGLGLLVLLPGVLFAPRARVARCTATPDSPTPPRSRARGCSVAVARRQS